MYQQPQHKQPNESDRHSKSKTGSNVQTSPSDVPSLNHVVRKISGLIDNNLLPNFEKLPPSLDGSVREDLPEDPLPSYLEVADTDYVIDKIADQIENGLRIGKLEILGDVEILVPCDLIRQIAEDVVETSECEPCGLRGCVIYINLEEERSTSSGNPIKEIQRIICFKPIGSNPVPTFELTLNLKKCKIGWFNTVSSKLFYNSLFGGKQSIVISDSYQLSKKKLFR